MAVERLVQSAEPLEDQGPLHLQPCRFLAAEDACRLVRLAEPRARLAAVRQRERGGSSAPRMARTRSTCALRELDRAPEVRLRRIDLPHLFGHEAECPFGNRGRVRIALVDGSPERALGERPRPARLRRGRAIASAASSAGDMARAGADAAPLRS